MSTASNTRAWVLLLCGLVTGIASITTLPARAAAAALHPGPAAWLEEYWDVKPEKLAEFIQVYKREVYAISRQVPGYRGYTFLTNIPDAQGYPKLPRFPDSMITPHYGIHLQGKILTERSVDLGNLLRRTHNVVIVHHLQTWTDAEAFRRNMEKIYATNSRGQNLWDHLAAVLFPLANNYWETSFRLIETGLPVVAAKGSGRKDADGLDLEPHPSDSGWFKEYFEVDAEHLQAFLKVYENNTYAVMSKIPNYQGVTIVTSLPPSPAEAKRTQYKKQMLGGPSSFYVPQKGVLMDGVVRTDTSINFSLLFKDTFTVITYFQLPWSTKMLQEMQKNFEVDHPGQDRLKYISQVLFPLARNHWDMSYRAIETSFVPLSAPHFEH